MAERNFDYVETLGRKKRKVMGSFKPNGSSAIDETNNTGTGFSVAYSTTGVYLVTLTDKFGPAVKLEARLVQATRTQDVEVASYNQSTGVVTIHGFARGGTTLADITAASGTQIYFEFGFDDALEN